jgi:hypothetical protein
MTDKATEQQIKDYLLGELAENEVERVEESIFTDDELFSEAQAIEMSLVDGYVRNELPEEEKTRFETQYLVTPERRQKVSEAKLFHEELRAIRPLPQISEDRAKWFERIISGWRLPVMQYASAALILLLAISTSWLFYDGWKARRELAMARNSLANSETTLNERLAEKESQLNEKLAEQRGEDSESLSALQTEVDDVRRQLEAIKRKPSNTSIAPSSTIATIFLPVVRGGMTPLTTATITKETKVLNVTVPIADADGEIFDIAISHDGRLILKRTGLRAVSGGEGKVLSIPLSAHNGSNGKYDVFLKSDNGTQKTRSFMVMVK